jgi:phospholipid/cholesterol/gamma-HCH transport system substrate-binding protein
MRIDTDRLRLELRRSSRPFALVIVLMVAGLAATLLMFRNLSFERPWDPYRQVDVAFADVKGATPGHQPVRISGVNVGVVRDWRVEGDHAVLTLAIRERYARHIYRDAQARLRPVTPLQDVYVALTRGTPRAGELPEGATIPGSQTVTPVDISRVLNVFDSDSREQLGNLVRGLGSGLDDQGAQLRRAFSQTVPFLVAARDLSTALGDRRHQLARLVHSFGGITDALASRDRQLAALVSDGNATLGQLAAHEAPLSETIRALPATVQSMRTSLASLASAEDELDPALHALQPVAEALDPGLSALERFSAGATPALRGLTPAVGELRPLAAALDPAVRDAQLAAERLRPQVPQIDEMTRMITRCEDTISKFFQWTPSVMKFGDANGANPRAEASIGLDTPPTQLPEPSLKHPRVCTDGFEQEDGG